MNTSGGVAPGTARTGASAEKADGPKPRTCLYMRDFAWANGVYPEVDIQRLSHHAAHCLPCMEEFVRLMRAAASATP